MSNEICPECRQRTFRKVICSIAFQCDNIYCGYVEEMPYWMKDKLITDADELCKFIRELGITQLEYELYQEKEV